MLPNFTGVLAVKTFDIDARRWYFEYRVYVQGKKLFVCDFSTREDAESELALELDRLGTKDERWGD